MSVYGYIVESNEMSNVSDGNHTFMELYDHRSLLFITLCKLLQEKGIDIWRSYYNDKGEEQGEYFLLGANYEDGKQISYHMEKKFYPLTEFATTLDKAPNFDGHNSEDVLNRLKNIYLKM